MIVKSKPFPQIRAEERSSLVILDTAIALIPPFFMAVFYYGIRSLALGALTVLAALVTNWISSLFNGRGIEWWQSLLFLLLNSLTAVPETMSLIRRLQDLPL